MGREMRVGGRRKEASHWLDIMVYCFAILRSLISHTVIADVFPYNLSNSISQKFLKWGSSEQNVLKV